MSQTLACLFCVVGPYVQLQEMIKKRSNYCGKNTKPLANKCSFVYEAFLFNFRTYERRKCSLRSSEVFVENEDKSPKIISREATT